MVARGLRHAIFIQGSQAKMGDPNGFALREEMLGPGWPEGASLCVCESEDRKNKARAGEKCSRLPLWYAGGSSSALVRRRPSRREAFFEVYRDLLNSIETRNGRQFQEIFSLP